MCGGPQGIHHGIGRNLWNVNEYWGITGSWDEDVEEAGVEELRNGGKRHDLRSGRGARSILGGWCGHAGDGCDRSKLVGLDPEY